jgi:hypothetical protein
MRREHCKVTNPASVETLKTEHARLEARLNEEAHRPLPDDDMIKRIKREKLRIKDKIASLQSV